MSRAEERAFERYPDYREMDGEYVTQIHKRKVFVEGYHQAEKDNELTWEDMKRIIKYHQDIMAEKSRPFVRVEDYKEVLKRFKDFKERCIGHTIEKLRDILGNYNNIKAYQYPGKQVIEDALRLFNSISNIRDTSEVFEEISNRKDEIAEITPKIDTISEFFKGSQKEQFDKVRETIITYDKSNPQYDMFDKVVENQLNKK